MPKQEIESLNITQQVLRGLTLALVASNAIPLDKFSTLLGSVITENMDPMAKTMLADLAEGMGVLHSAMHTTQ